MPHRQGTQCQTGRRDARQAAPDERAERRNGARCGTEERSDGQTGCARGPARRNVGQAGCYVGTGGRMSNQKARCQTSRQSAGQAKRAPDQQGRMSADRPFAGPASCPAKRLRAFRSAAVGRVARRGPGASRPGPGRRPRPAPAMADLSSRRGAPCCRALRARARWSRGRAPMLARRPGRQRRSWRRSWPSAPSTARSGPSRRR